MEVSVKLMRQMEEVEPSIRKVLYAILEEIEQQSKERVTKDEFYELRDVLGELASAQARTEQRLDALAEAQAKTEKRLEGLTQRVDALAEAQTKTEKRLEGLTQRVEALAEAQARTEQRLDALAEAQAKTEKRLEGLAKAQEKTEKVLYKIAKSHNTLKETVSGLSDSIGYGIEDKLMPYIPAYAQKIYGLQVNSVERENIVYESGKYDEINILARGRNKEGPAFLVAECKAKPGKKDIRKFAQVLKRLEDYFTGSIYALLVGYTFAPEVETYRQKNYPQIHLIKTYQIQREAEA